MHPQNIIPEVEYGDGFNQLPPINVESAPRSSMLNAVGSPNTSSRDNKAFIDHEVILHQQKDENGGANDRYKLSEEYRDVRSSEELASSSWHSSRRDIPTMDLGASAEISILSGGGIEDNVSARKRPETVERLELPHSSSESEKDQAFDDGGEEISIGIFANCPDVPSSSNLSFFYLFIV